MAEADKVVSFAENLLSLGSEVRQLRKARQMTLKDLTKASGISLSHLSAIERGASNPSMKLAATKSAEKVADLQRQIDEERDAIRHLKAEWSKLNKPERLQGLVERYNDYLQLEALDVKQIVTPEELPARPVMLEPIGGPNQMGGYAGSSSAIQ